MKWRCYANRWQPGLPEGKASNRSKAEVLFAARSHVEGVLARRTGNRLETLRFDKGIHLLIGGTIPLCRKYSTICP